MLVMTPGTPLIFPGAGPECQPTTLIPAATACSMIGACSAASIVPRMMPVGLQSDRLGQRGRTRGDRALPVEDAEIPAHRLGGLLSAIADALSAAVLLVGRDVDDQLPALRLWTGGRTGPGRDRRGRLRDVFLGHFHERVIGRLGRDDGQSDDCRRSQQAPANQTKSQHPIPPCEMLASHRLAKPVVPALQRRPGLAADTG